LAGFFESHFPVIPQVLDGITAAPALPAPPFAVFALFRPGPEPVIAATKGTGDGIFASLSSGNACNPGAVGL
jgi:hypothetical protein